MSLEIAGLTVDIDGRRVLDGIDLLVEDGERVGLIGESGSGKSLTALAILGLLPRGAEVRGSIRLNGRELVGRTDRELARVRGREVGIVFQEPATALNPIKTVGWQIGETLRIHDRLGHAASRARAVELAAQVALPDPERIVRLYPHQLSGGQRQRVAIAIALAANPGLLIADEPTTALDVTIQAGILDLFDRTVTERGASLVFITHDLAVLSRIARRAVVLAGGKVIETGSIEQIVYEPTHEITAKLAAAARATSWVEAS